MEEPEASPAPRPSKTPRHGQEAPVLPDEVIVEQILPRVPAADTVRYQAVCQAWRAALTSDHFVHAYQAIRAAAAAAAQPPEIIFFVPAGAGSTAFYSSSLRPSTPPPAAAARELVTVGNLRACELVPSGTKSCRGLTLLYHPRENAYHVCNLSTGEHISLAPCPWAHMAKAHAYRRYPYMLSSAGLGFDPAAGEHVVVRLFEDWSLRQRCEVFGLRSGGWRPLAAAGGRVRVPEHAGKGLNGLPPVFVPAGGGRFYWHINTGFNFRGFEERMRYATPEPILSLSLGTGEFGWVRVPEELARREFRLAELDGELCASVDMRIGGVEEYELWVRTAAAWSLRCRISLASLPWPMRVGLGSGFRVLPLGSWGGKILLGTSRHEVYAYDPEENSVDRVFSVQDFMDAPREPELLLNIAMHEETITGVRHRPLAGEVGKLKMKLGRTSVPRRVPAEQHRQDSTVEQQQVQQMFGVAMAVLRDFINGQI